MTKPLQVKKPIPIPLALRFIQTAFPILEVISVRLAIQYFASIFFTPMRYKTPEKELAAQKLAEKFSVVCDGKRIQCYEWGDTTKPYVLVIHGWAGRATQFRKFVPIFNDGGYRIIGFDGPAHGKSEGKRATINSFTEVMHAIASIKGNPVGIISHSFGGGASLFAIVNGFPVRKLINIASPTIADRIIDSYRKVIGASMKVATGFKKFIQQKYGKPFEEFTALELIKRVPAELKFMIVHDKNDREVELVHVQELAKVFPKVRLHITEGLGHNRILKDDLVILSCFTFMREN
jgi:pimeloyl-ACP methyl ester carboxylesterase